VGEMLEASYIRDVKLLSSARRIRLDEPLKLDGRMLTIGMIPLF
jgi:hypothetical protein